MGEVTMLSRMIACGLICTFECNGSPQRDLMLTVRIAGRTKEHVYVCEHEMGSSALITRAWDEWKSYCSERDLSRSYYE